jgi:hypothetical protein
LLIEIPKIKGDQERGLARLKLRLPRWRTRFDLASSRSFLDLCEDYELASRALDDWAKSDMPTKSVVIAYYREIIDSLELEAQLLATRDAEEPKPRR